MKLTTRLLIRLFFCIALSTIIKHGFAQLTFVGGGFSDINIMNSVTGISSIHKFPIHDPTSAISVVAGAGGKLYGLTISGGPDQSGTIFSVDSNGSNFRICFNMPVNGGYLHVGADSQLYFNFNQQFFKLDPENGSKQLIATIEGSNVAFSVAVDGWLYGSRSLIEANRYVYSLFKVRIDGSNYQVLHTFNPDTEGNWDRGQAPTVSPSGTMYGCCSGGQYGLGTFFKMRTDGSGFSIVKTFDNSQEAAYPLTGTPLAIANGKVYFSVTAGGAFYSGKIICFDTTSAILTGVYDLQNTPRTNPIVAGGKLVSIGQTGLFSINLDGSGFTEMSNYEYLSGSIRIATNGQSNSVFHIASDGSYKNTVLLKNFTNSSDTAQLRSFGNVPNGYSTLGLIKARDGKLYGTTINGGITGGGTFFKLNQDGTGYSKLYDFAGNSAQSPIGLVQQASDGRFYGTCSRNGINGSGYGQSLFSIDSTGTDFRVLRTLGGSEGFPREMLTEGASGVLFGLTENPSSIFRINTNGTGFTVLKTLTDAEGASPRQGLVYDNGFLYGVCAGGGSGGGGTVFRIRENGANFSIIRQFSFFDSAGFGPLYGLRKFSNGKLYGCTAFAGFYGSGTVFSVDPSTLSFKNIYFFNAAIDGPEIPYGRLTEGSDGRIYIYKAGLTSIDTTGNNPRTVPFLSGDFYDLVEIASLNNCDSGAYQFATSIAGANYFYQWQINTSAGFTNISNDSVYSNVNTSTLQLNNVPASYSGNQYRCAVNTGTAILYTTLYDLKLQNIWTGAADGNWNNANNWACGKVPGDQSNVIIPPFKPNYPLVSSPAKCKIIQVQKGASVTVQTGADLEVTGH